MIIPTGGDLLADDADALVNPVNCVGVMGKGLALQFKQAHPAAFRAYALACSTGQMKPGVMHTAYTQDRRQCIVHFPTKRHWRDPSRMVDIETGLIALVDLIDEMGIRSIAVPPLGAGLGGLPWVDVEAAIRHHLEPLADVDVRLYLPTSAPRGARR